MGITQIPYDRLIRSTRQPKIVGFDRLKSKRIARINPKKDILMVRTKLGLSQTKFADALGISENTLQNWEQGRRSPTGPAKILLKIAAMRPEILLEVE